jgi:beta-lactamase regulating signal transducer with metallopeptidase domain
MTAAWTLALVHSLWQETLVALVFACARAIVGPKRANARYFAGCIALLSALVLPLATFLEIECSMQTAIAEAHDANRLTSWIPIAWALGFEALSIRIVLGLRRIREIVQSASPLAPKWQARFDRVREGLAPNRAVRWLATDRISVPMTVGVLRPVILLPFATLAGMSPAELELIVAHELAHIRRFDYLVNLAQSIVEAIYFFHPAVWWISSRVREDREACCDDVVVRSYGDPFAYARALTELEAASDQGTELMLASRKGALMNRIQRLIETREPSIPAFAWLLGSTLALFLVLAGVWTHNARAERPIAGAVTLDWLPPSILVHRPLIEEAARRYGLDPNILAVVVLVESGGDAAARSPFGARGLMQVMPKTGAAIARERRRPFREDDLEDPAYNLDVGAFYLAKQLSDFASTPNPLDAAVAAYNGGESQVRAWLSGQGQLSDETTHYKALIGSLLTGGEASYEGWRAPFRSRLVHAALPPISNISEKSAAHTICGSGGGIDLFATEGTQVSSPLAGVVARVVKDPDRGVDVVVRHKGGFETAYHHLGSAAVHPAKVVEKGEILGTVGACEVGFELRDLGASIDPRPIASKR